MVEVGSVSKDGKSQVTKKIQDCPTKVYDELYMISGSYTPTDFNQALLDDIKKIGIICSQKKTHTELSQNGTSSFYWHVDCATTSGSSVGIKPYALYFHTPHNYFSFPVYRDSL